MLARPNATNSWVLMVIVLVPSMGLGVVVLITAMGLPTCSLGEPVSAIIAMVSLKASGTLTTGFAGSSTTFLAAALAGEVSWTGARPFGFWVYRFAGAGITFSNGFLAAA